ncbi:pectinesterase-like [Wolffia australiana]
MGSVSLCMFYACLALVAGFASGGPITSCRDTPYPDVCREAVGPIALNGESKAPMSFAKLNVRGALQRASLTRAAAWKIDLRTLDPRARAAWEDCLALAEDTVGQLNRVLDPDVPSSSDDELTWLSAAMTHHETCLEGFRDLGLDSKLASTPFASPNVTRMLANSLAVTSSASVSGAGNRRLLSSRGFPNWVSAADRRLLQSTSVRADVVVAKDGSGNYKTISEAAAAAAKRTGTARFVIYVKAGTYSENVQISAKNVMLLGDGKDKTVVTGSKNVVDGSTTFNSATVAVTGSGFIAKGITFENTAGPAKHQAVAFRSGSDLSVCYQCSFKGYQDTLYVYTQRQFYRDCDIYGTVDFIFGNAAVVIQNCNILLRRPMSNQKNTITAQGRSDKNQNTGISIHNSRVAAAEALGSIRSFLGRPWKEFSRTVFMKCALDGIIDRAGWLEWSGNFALSTLYYGEYLNTGAGAETSGRVKWGGYKVISSATEAGQFTVGNFIGGSSWLGSTGVPFTATL